MSLSIVTNLAALQANTYLNQTSNAEATAVQRLSSGYKINSAADDPAGLVISEGMKAQISGLGQAMDNTQEADNMVKTAEGAMAQINSLLNNIRDLTVNAQNTGVNDANAIAADQAQSDQMVASIDNIASTTQFDGKNLLDGTATGLQLQIGANDGQTTSLDLPDMTSATLGVDKLALDASGTLSTIDSAISTVSTARATLGAFETGTLQSNLNSLSVAKQNITAANSTIADADMASEMVNFTKDQILMQAGTAMMAQANQAPTTILKMLQ